MRSRRRCASAATTPMPTRRSRTRWTSASAPGLVAQSVEATSTRAVNLALCGPVDAAREAADEAAGLADRLRYPVGTAASLEARGAAYTDLELLAQAQRAWENLGRTTDAERVKSLSEQLATSN